MEKQFGKPNTLIGLEDGDYSNKKHSLTTLIHSEVGKINGQKNVESGHWASLKTPKHQSKAGKISGKKHVESGHWASLKTPKHQSKAGKIGGKKAGAIQGPIQGKINADKMQTCPWCFKTIKFLGYIRWHGDRCKFAW